MRDFGVPDRAASDAETRMTAYVHPQDAGWDDTFLLLSVPMSSRGEFPALWHALPWVALTQETRV